MSNGCWRLLIGQDSRFGGTETSRRSAVQCRLSDWSHYSAGVASAGPQLLLSVGKSAGRRRCDWGSRSSRWNSKTWCGRWSRWLLHEYPPPRLVDGVLHDPRHTHAANAGSGDSRFAARCLWQILPPRCAEHLNARVRYSACACYVARCTVKPVRLRSVRRGSRDARPRLRWKPFGAEAPFAETAYAARRPRMKGSPNHRATGSPWVNRSQSAVAWSLQAIAEE